MIRLKRAYEPSSASDGRRVLVERLWPRGVSKEVASLSLWLRDVAPSTALRQWFGHEASRWEEFQRRYRTELEENGEAIAQLIGLVKAGRVTLLYGAHDPLHNNAVALAGYIRDMLRQ